MTHIQDVRHEETRARSPATRRATWIVQVPAGCRSVIQGEYRSRERRVQGSVRRCDLRRVPLSGAPELAFGPYVGPGDWPDGTRPWSHRASFRFLDFASDAAVKPFDTLLLVQISVACDEPLRDQEFVSGCGYSTYVLSRIVINPLSRPYESTRKDIEVQAYVGLALPRHLFEEPCTWAGADTSGETFRPS